MSSLPGPTVDVDAAVTSCDLAAYLAGTSSSNISVYVISRLLLFSVLRYHVVLNYQVGLNTHILTCHGVVILTCL